MGRIRMIFLAFLALAVMSLILIALLGQCDAVPQ